MDHLDNRPSGHARQVNNSERYLTFQLGKDQYAIPLLQVKEVIEMTEPTPIPNAAPAFKGVINLRGQVISVMDLRMKLKMDKIANGPKTSIIILDMAVDSNVATGVIVDRINGVLGFGLENISSPPDMKVSQNQQEVLTGIAHQNGKMTLILNLMATLSVASATPTQNVNHKKAA